MHTHTNHHTATGKRPGTKRRTRTGVMLAAIILPLLAACGPDNGDDATSTAANEDNPVAAWFSSDPITVGDQPIHQFRTSVQPGDSVAFTGKVMGRMQVFVPSRAAFIVGDPGIITTCDLIPGDDCETPWDACCEDPDNIAAGIVTVQLVGDDGRVLAHELRGVHGLTELSEVSIEGTVAAASGNGNLIIEASRIHVHP